MKKTYITPVTERHPVASIQPIATSYEDIHAGGTGTPGIKRNSFGTAPEDDDEDYMNFDLNNYDIK